MTEHSLAAPHTTLPSGLLVPPGVEIAPPTGINTEADLPENTETASEDLAEQIEQTAETQETENQDNIHINRINEIAEQYRTPQQDGLEARIEPNLLQELIRSYVEKSTDRAETIAASRLAYLSTTNDIFNNHMKLINTVLFLAEQNEIKLRVIKVSPTLDSHEIEVPVTPSGSYTFNELLHIAAMISSRLNKYKLAATNAANEVSKLKAQIQALEQSYFKSERERSRLVSLPVAPSSLPLGVTPYVLMRVTQTEKARVIRYLGKNEEGFYTATSSLKEAVRFADLRLASEKFIQLMNDPENVDNIEDLALFEPNVLLYKSMTLPGEIDEELLRRINSAREQALTINHENRRRETKLFEQDAKPAIKTQKVEAKDETKINKPKNKKSKLSRMIEEEFNKRIKRG